MSAAIRGVTAKFFEEFCQEFSKILGFQPTVLG
jgi:hypothetical protein